MLNLTCELRYIFRTLGVVILCVRGCGKYGLLKSSRWGGCVVAAGRGRGRPMMGFATHAA